MADWLGMCSPSYSGDHQSLPQGTPGPCQLSSTLPAKHRTLKIKVLTHLQSSIHAIVLERHQNRQSINACMHALQLTAVNPLPFRVAGAF
jgi:hypothetical protein